MAHAILHPGIDLSAARPGLFGRLAETVATWRRRIRERDELAAMTTFDLHDVGLNSSEAYYEINKPFWRD